MFHYRSFVSLIGCLTLASVVAGCGDSPTAPGPTFAQTDLRVGTGTQAQIGYDVTVFYTGWIYDDSRPDDKGLRFDSNVGGNPFTFRLGIGQVIEGWDVGLVGIQAGGIRRLVIPPGLAYGGIRNGPIPPNATLVFDVEVTAVQAPE